MKTFLEQDEKLATLCARSRVNGSVQPLLDGLAEIYPELEFKPVLTRGGWYRLGGVVDSNYRPISDNIVKWAEQESNGNVELLVIEYMDVMYFATRLLGKTHYFNARIGDGPEDYIQLEIDELQEVLDRPLVDADWLPTSLDEFLDPLDYPRLAPEPVDRPYYLFRRITPIHQLVDESADATRSMDNVRQLLSDWGQSSAGESASFSDHWILVLREYASRDGLVGLNAKPLHTRVDRSPSLPDSGFLSGPALANALYQYDRFMGYPFSWFFTMLSNCADNCALANAVLRDQSGAYDYLPQRDLNVLRDWKARPYSV